VTPDGTAVFDPRTPAEVRTGLQRLRRLVTDQETAELRSQMVAVEEDRVMVPGSTAYAVHGNFVQLPSGLLVPAGAAPRPLDMAAVYITGRELFGVAPGPAYTVDQLQGLSFAEVLSFVASTLVLYRDLESSDREADLQFADRWLNGDALQRAKNLLRTPARRLVVPQALYVLAKLAAVHSPDTVAPEVEAGRPPGALFGAVEVLERPRAQPADDDEIVDTRVTELSSYMVANHHLNQPVDVDQLMARFVRLWLELPVERAQEKKVINLEKTFRDVTGITINDLLALTMWLWTCGQNGTPHVPWDLLQETMRWSSERLEATLRLFATDVQTLRTGLRGEAEPAFVWAFDTLERYPVVRLEDGSVLLLDSNLLLRHVFGGLTLLDLVDALEQSPDEKSRKLKNQVLDCVRYLAEVYALEVLTSLAGPGPGSTRVFGDIELRRAFGRAGRRICDAAVDYGDAWVVVEITTSKLTRGSVAASPEALSGDLDKLVAKAEQLHSTIAALRAEESLLTGRPAHAVRRFFPLLVAAEGFPVNPISTELLRSRVREKGLLTDPDIAPLEVVDTVELAMLEGLAEQGGPSMRDVLAAKERAVFHRMGLRDYLLQEARLRPRRTQRVQELMDKAWEPALDTLRPTPAT